MEVATGFYGCVSDDQRTKATKEAEEDGGIFDLFSLRTELPNKRKGLSLYFSGKSRSFTRIDEAKCIGDLEKLEIPEAKRRKYGLYRCGSSCLSFMEAVAEK